MIELGACDADVSDATCASYVQTVAAITRVNLSDVAAGADKFVVARQPAVGAGVMSVADVQRGLTAIGFFPGGTVDGICGYRTLSALRLFQEYVRSVEKLDCVPDGRFGPQSQQHLRRWVDKGLRPNWTAIIERWQSGTLAPGEYADWLALLGAVKARYTASPNAWLQQVNSLGKSDTRKVADWDFAAAGSAQLVGVRRAEFSDKFDDIFVLLVKGMVFKFQGTTEPGASTDPRGTPFLVQGQHDYHFGWHHKTYLALRPQSVGVLVARSKNDMRLDEADLAGGLAPEPSINVHWGGMGLTRDVNTWSEGCQVINGGYYINANNDLIDCSAFAAVSSTDPTNVQSKKTRGAYNVLLDLVSALVSDAKANTVRYTLLVEDDLDLAPAVKQSLADARRRVMTAIGH